MHRTLGIAAGLVLLSCSSSQPGSICDGACSQADLGADLAVPAADLAVPAADLTTPVADLAVPADLTPPADLAPPADLRLAAPTLTAASPARISTAGGTDVTLTGTGFVTGATVLFGGVAATAVTVSGPTQLVATSPQRLGKLGATPLVVRNPDSQTASRADLLFSFAALTFAARQGFASSGAGSAMDRAIPGDFNADGKPDIATAMHGSDGLLLYLGKGDGTFEAARRTLCGTAPFDLSAGDFNGDGKLDLVGANYNSNDVCLLLGKGDGTFEAARKFAVGDGPYGILAGDFNNDNKPDLAVSNFRGKTLSLLLGKGDGTFEAQRTQALQNSLGLGAADLNTDGKLDLLVPDNSTGLLVLLGKGDGTFETAVKYLATAGGGGTYSVTLADLNRDGKLDAIVPHAAAVGILLGKGDGTFQQPPLLTEAITNATYVAAGDLDGDGRPDLAVASYPTRSLYTLLGKGDGTFEARKLIAGSDGLDTYSVVALDLNIDGRQDLVFTDYATPTLQSVLNSSQ